MANDQSSHFYDAQNKLVGSENSTDIIIYNINDSKIEVKINNQASKFLNYSLVKESGKQFILTGTAPDIIKSEILKIESTTMTWKSIENFPPDHIDIIDGKPVPVSKIEQTVDFKKI